MIKSKESSIIIDATPDLRQQLLNANVKKLDAILVTHTHSDHINGIDDFRFLNVIMKKDINLYASEHGINQIKQRFGYVFEKLLPEANGFYYKPCLNPKVIKGSFKIKDLTISSILQNHGFTESLGFRINNLLIVLMFLTLKSHNSKSLKIWICGL